METWARLYRCRKCGKWSHAKRKPRKHKRWVQDGYDPEYNPELNEVEQSYDHINGFTEFADGHFVDCGPFDYWHATYQGYDEKDGNPND